MWLGVINIIYIPNTNGPDLDCILFFFNLDNTLQGIFVFVYNQIYII